MQEGLALGRALVEDNPQMVRIAEDAGLADHPAFLLLAEQAARAAGYTVGTKHPSAPQQQQPQSGAPTMRTGNLSREQFNKGMDSFNQRIADAQNRGDGRTANDIHQEQMRWIASVQGGDGQIVDGRRTA